MYVSTEDFDLVCMDDAGDVHCEDCCTCGADEETNEGKTVMTEEQKQIIQNCIDALRRESVNNLNIDFNSYEDFIDHVESVADILASLIKTRRSWERAIGKPSGIRER